MNAFGVSDHHVSGLRLKPEFVEYLQYEPYAVLLQSFEPNAIPGLLQTQAYAEAINYAAAPDGIDMKTLQLQVQHRMRRQNLLRAQNPPRMHFVIDEAALLRRDDPGPDGKQVMREQIQHLRICSQLAHITIGILPLDRGLHRSLDGGFVILPLPDGDTVLYEERLGSGSSISVHLDTVGPALNRFADLAALATGLPQEPEHA